MRKVLVAVVAALIAVIPVVFVAAAGATPGPAPSTLHGFTGPGGGSPLVNSEAGVCGPTGGFILFGYHNVPIVPADGSNTTGDDVFGTNDDEGFASLNYLGSLSANNSDCETPPSLPHIYNNPNWNNSTGGDWPNFNWLINGTNKQLIITGPNNNWTDCINPLNGFALTGRDASAATQWESITWTNTTGACSTESSHVGPVCVNGAGGEIDGAFVLLAHYDSVLSEPDWWCYQAAGTYTSTEYGSSAKQFWATTWSNRVWLHQNSDGSGQNECFNWQAVYDTVVDAILGVGDADDPSYTWLQNPGNVQLTSNTSTC